MEIQKVMLFYNGLGIPTRQILDSRGEIPSKTTADAKLDANNAKDPITPKIAHSKKKGKPLKKLTTCNLVDLFKERDIEQQLRDSIKGTMRILRTKNEGNERGFRSLPSSTEANTRGQVKSISTTVEVDSYLIRHIGSSQYAISTGQNYTLMYETRQTTILFPCRLNGYCCNGKKGSYRPQFSEAYSKASHIDNSIPIKEKDPGSFTLPCFINNICFDNTLVDLGASVSVMPLSTYLNLGLGKLAHTKLTVELADRTVKYPKGIAKTC
ncbi:ATP-dependent DNA helicase PIF1-like protein [Tanacetum coccineum]